MASDICLMHRGDLRKHAVSLMEEVGGSGKCDWIMKVPVSSYVNAPKSHRTLAVQMLGRRWLRWLWLFARCGCCACFAFPSCTFAFAARKGVTVYRRRFIAFLRESLTLSRVFGNSDALTCHEQMGKDLLFKTEDKPLTVLFSYQIRTGDGLDPSSGLSFN